MRKTASLLATLALFLGLTTVAAHAGQLKIFAAASLTNAVGAMRADYQQRHPGDTLEATFAASGDLLSRMQAGQTCDVFLSADIATMTTAVDKGNVVADSRIVFAGNEMVLAVPKGNPAEVTGLESLSMGGIRRIGVGNPESVPAGRYARHALQQKALWFALTSKLVYYISVRHVLAAIAHDKLDAGFVYATDAAIAANNVQVAATIPLTPPVTYTAAISSTAANATDAKSFLTYLQSPKARAILTRFGFSTP